MAIKTVIEFEDSGEECKMRISWNTSVIGAAAQNEFDRERMLRYEFLIYLYHISDRNQYFFGHGNVNISIRYIVSRMY